MKIRRQDILELLDTALPQIFRIPTAAAWVLLFPHILWILLFSYPVPLSKLETSDSRCLSKVIYEPGAHGAQV